MPRTRHTSATLLKEFCTDNMIDRLFSWVGDEKHRGWVPTPPTSGLSLYPL